MNIEPSPNAQMPAGKAQNATDPVGEDSGLFDGGEFMRESFQLPKSTAGGHLFLVGNILKHQSRRAMQNRDARFHLGRLNVGDQSPLEPIPGHRRRNQR